MTVSTHYSIVRRVRLTGTHTEVTKAVERLHKKDEGWVCTRSNPVVHAGKITFTYGATLERRIG